jgi:hypothetical protein
VDNLFRMYVSHGGECKNRDKTYRTDDSEFTFYNDLLRFKVYPHKEVARSILAPRKQAQATTSSTATTG